MEREAAAFLADLDDRQRAAAVRSFGDDQRRWLEYRPEPRPGLLLADMGQATRKAAHRLDHVIVRDLQPQACAYVHAWREQRLSDHSGIWARLAPVG